MANKNYIFYCTGDGTIGFEEEGLVNIVNLFPHVSMECKQFPSYSTNIYTKFQLPQIQVFTCTLHSLQIYREF